MTTHEGDSFLAADGTISRRRLLATAAKFGAGAVALSGAGGVLLSACGDSDSNASDSSGPFKLGWIRPTTGLYASGFAPIYVSGLIAVDEINAAGGIMGRQIERSEYDDEGDPAKEPSLVTRLQSDKINY